MNKFLSSIILFFLAFDPQVPFLPNGVGFSFLIFFILLPVFLLKCFQGRIGGIVKAASPILILFFFIWIYVTLKLIANGGDNVEFLLSLLKAFFIFGAIFLFFAVFYGEREVGREFVFKLIFVYVLNAIFNFIIGSYPEQFNFLNVFRSQTITDSLGGNPYRNSFISGSGYFSIGTAYGLAALFTSFCIVKYNVRHVLLGAAVVIVGIAGFVAARTSFFAILFSSLYVFAKKPLYAFFIASLAFLLLSLVLFLPALQPYIEWMKSFFIEFESSGSANYLLSEMYFWPGADIFFFGSGAVNDGAFVYTDAGYMQDVLFGGVFYLALKLLFVAIYFYAAQKISFGYSALFCISVLLFHIKGLFIFSNAQGMAIFYFSYFYFRLFKDAKFNYSC